MIFKPLFISILLLIAVRAQPSEPLRVKPVITPGSADGSGSCPTSDVLEATTSNIFEAVRVQFLISPDCGGFGWRQVADLDMEVASQQCPSPWIEVSTPARSCASSISTGGCEGVSFPVSGGTYTRVCGRVVGYASETLDAFLDYNGLGDGNIDNPYLDGVSVTYGSPRQHIWSLAAEDSIGGSVCPCDNLQAPLPPSFVGDNYFCDGEYNGALWDGEDCTTACCTFNSPPYFNVTLPAPTSDAIEVRICRDEPRHTEDIHIHFLQLFVQ